MGVIPLFPHSLLSTGKSIKTRASGYAFGQGGHQIVLKAHEP